MVLILWSPWKLRVVTSSLPIRYCVTIRHVNISLQLMYCHFKNVACMQQNVSMSVLYVLLAILMSSCLRVLSWAVIFIIQMRFPPGKSLATIFFIISLYYLYLVSSPIYNLVFSIVHLVKSYACKLLLFTCTDDYRWLYFRRKFFVKYRLSSSSLRGYIQDDGGRSKAAFNGSLIKYMCCLKYLETIYH